MLVYFVCVATLAVGLDFKLLSASVPLGIGALIATWLPQWGYHILGLSLFLTTYLFGVVWRLPSQPVVPVPSADK